MAPEMLKGNVSGSADIFSLGLITLEAAANVVLPDNGPTWLALRSGDLSEVPSLTWTPSVESRRTGHPTDSGLSDELGAVRTHDGGNLFGSLKRSELQQPPDFMVDPTHPSSLDSIVRWMTAQEPSQRPLADQILELEGLRWIAEHRSAPATVYEGSWGPAETMPVSIMLDSDSEMIDV
jgi:mitosis inhibitor protein kinase SWE1